jgi:endonuclease III
VKTETLAAAIGSAGLATQKAQRLKATADQIRERAGEVSLDFLHEMDTDAADLYLRGLRGVGVKTARCILMYSLGRSVFPLDTHCGRIIARLGWLAHAPQDPSLSEAQRIEAAIPEDLRRTLHIRGVQHGRAICLARGPECSACVVRSFCDFYREKRHAEGEIHE